jgi:integrase
MSAAADVAKISVRSDELSRPRDWFLRGCSWADDRWEFSPTCVHEEEHPIQLRWDFKLPSGDRFTDFAHSALLESARQLIALIRERSFSAARPQRASSARTHFIRLRSLVCWMKQEGYSRFADLDREALLRFRHVVSGRRGRGGGMVSASTVALVFRLLQYLYQYRAELDDALMVDPCEGRSAQAAAGVRPATCGRLPYTPELVAVALVQGAIELLEMSAVDLLAGRERYAAAYALGSQRGQGRTGCRLAALRALRTHAIRVPSGQCTVRTLRELGEWLERLYIACFVVISYLIGPRVSEVLALRVGCVRRLGGDPMDAPDSPRVIVGSIFKLEPEYHGRRHEWVAPPPALHAVAVLEALSSPHRHRSGRPDLWLRPKQRHFGVAEWRPDAAVTLWIPHSAWINEGLARFGKWLALPAWEGRPWRLSSHQGRKSFARFAALRDRTSLYALAQHLGHRDRMNTDQGYAGTDYALGREIDRSVLEQSIDSWEHMLSAPILGGRAGEEILATRPRFHGTHMKQEVRAYARLLSEAGLSLGVCDWGFCAYRREHSACLGTVMGPNPVRREPSTCARCRNFVLSTRHRSYWEDQAQRYERLLREPMLPTQTLKIARQRLGEALGLLRAIDALPKESIHER